MIQFEENTLYDISFYIDSELNIRVVGIPDIEETNVFCKRVANSTVFKIKSDLLGTWANRIITMQNNYAIYTGIDGFDVKYIGTKEENPEYFL